MMDQATPNLGPDPHVALAFSIQRNPGAYALLLGAGVSLASGVPTAWDVQQTLIGQIARAQGASALDPLRWYQETYGRPSTYDDLLAQLASSPAERQALLRSFFEPTDEERSQGIKAPTSAHRSIARLVQAGRIRIILTTNFDRLCETALRDVGVEPTVVTQSSELAGLSPLHSHRCLVVHLHGDFMTAAGMLNTPDELGAYRPELTEFLASVFGQYGLVIAGWSAVWDTALRAALDATPNRFYAMYWIDPLPLAETASALCGRRKAILLRGDADATFGQLADACDAIEETRARDPLTVAIAVASAKRALSGRYTAISLHDSVRSELERLRASEVLTDWSFSSSDTRAEHRRRLAVLESELQVPLALIATAAYWGDSTTDDFWMRDISRLGTRIPASGSVALINLTRLPATVLQYASGVAAAAALRYDLLARIFLEPTTEDLAGTRRTVLTGLSPTATLGLTDSNRHIFRLLRPIFCEQMALGYTAFREAWEVFEFLRLVELTYTALRERGDLGAIQMLLNRRVGQVRRFHSDLDGYREPALAEIGHIDAELRSARDTAAQVTPEPDAYLRLEASGRDVYRTPVSAALRYEVARNREDSDLVVAGLCGGNAGLLLEMMAVVDVRLSAAGSKAAWSALPPGGGVVPSGPFWPDAPTIVEK